MNDKPVIHLPALPKPSDRERRAELRKMREKLVMCPVVKLKTYKGLCELDDLLTKRIKRDEAEKKPSGSNKPKEPA